MTSEKYCVVNFTWYDIAGRQDEKLQRKNMSPLEKQFYKCDKKSYT